MWSRQALCAALVAALLVGPASAQIEDSGLGQVDPWGLGFLTPSDTAFQTGTWRGARSEDLLPMLKDVRTSGLTPAERTLLRRVILSPALAPVGDEADAMLAERARIAFELGEAQAAAALMTRLKTPPEGLQPDEIAADLNLAMGNEATACANLSDPDHEGAYWAKLRAVCAALSGNTSGAELAIEMAQSQGVKDSWLLNAVFAASGEMPNPPKARFEDGLSLAMSMRANLQATPKEAAPGRPDIAAAMARRRLLAPALRVKAANLAAADGLITADEHRKAYNAALAADGYVQATALDKAYFAASDAFKAKPEQAAALAAALKEASGDAARFAAVSRLLSADVARLPVDPDTAPYALTFARAAIGAGDMAEASRWTGAIDLEGATLPAFETAWIDGVVVLAGSNAGSRSVAKVSRRLMESATTTSEKRAAAQLMSLWSAFYTTAPSDGRNFIAVESAAPGKALPPGKVLAVLAATRSGAAAETVLRTLDITGGDPSKLDAADLAILVDALRRIGAEDAARVLAVEATGYWKTQK